MTHFNVSYELFESSLGRIVIVIASQSKLVLRNSSLNNYLTLLNS